MSEKRWFVLLCLCGLLLDSSPVRASFPHWAKGHTVDLDAPPPARERWFPWAETTLTLKRDGTRERRIRMLEFVSSELTADPELLSFHVAYFQELRSFIVHRLDPDGVVKEFSAVTLSNAYQDRVESSVSAMLEAPETRPGSYLAWEIVVKENFPTLRADQWWYPGQATITRAAYTLVRPEGVVAVGVRVGAAADVDTLTPSLESPKFLTWEAPVECFSALSEQSLESPSQLWISYSLPSAPGLGTWDAIGEWFTRLSEASLADTVGLSSFIRTSLTSTNDEPLREGLRWARDRIRYQQVYLGDGGHRPRPAVSVWRSGWGDCKDKATAVTALARRYGREARLVLVRTADLGPAIIPTPLAFNHAIVALRDPELPAGWAFVDATVPNTPVLRLPAMDEGASALIVDPDAGSMRVELPASRAGDNLSSFDLDLAIDSGGRITGSVRELHTGHAAGWRRGVLADLRPAEYPKALASSANLDDESQSIREVTIRGLATDDDTLDIRYTLVTRRRATRVEGGLLVAPDCVSATGDGFFDHPTGQPLQLPYAFEERTRIRMILPQGWSVESPSNGDDRVSSASSVGRYERMVRVSSDGLLLERRWRVERAKIASEQVRELTALDSVRALGDRRRVRLLSGSR